MAMRDRVLSIRRLVLAVLASAALLIAFVPGVALASGFGNVGYGTSLTVYSHYDGKIISGSRVDAYRVADIGPDGAPVPAGEFASYSVLWDVSSASSQQALANALEGYALRDGVVPTYSAVTDAAGAAIFPPEAGVEMTEGWYLVLIENYVDEDEMLETQPALISVSQGESQEAPLKMSITSLRRPSEEQVVIDATKIWKGEGAVLPESVSIQLLCDGAVCETVELNEENGWHYSWEGLSSAHRWTVMEESVPSDYRVAVERDGDSISLVNTYVPERTPDEPGGDVPGDEEEGGGDLPQTGGMWWPVPLLLFAGAASIAIGVLRLSCGRR